MSSAVFDQWLVADLHDIAASCLPHDLRTGHKDVLVGYYCLQVDAVLDISQSFYGQLQKLNFLTDGHSNVTDCQAGKTQTESAGSGMRMLLLHLTDGTIDVQAIEYQPVASLGQPMLHAGVKVVVGDTVMCRNGILLLTADNIRIYGGEVDSLTNDNRQCHLQQKLANNVKFAATNPDLPSSKLSGVHNTGCQHGLSSELTALATTDKTGASAISVIRSSMQANIATVSSGISTDSRTDHMHCNNVQLPMTSSVDLLSETADRVSFTYLSLISERCLTMNRLLYTVKAFIVTLLSRLDCNEGRFWSLRVRINDGSAVLDVTVSDEILRGMIGFTAEQTETIRHDKLDKQSRLRLAEGVRHCQDTLAHLSAIFVLRIGFDSSVLLQYRSVSVDDVNVLRQRCTRS